jgi:hypothetical protein
MPLRTNPEREYASRTPAPTWGRLLPKGDESSTIRFEPTPGRSISLPVHCLKRWLYTEGPAESLQILADELQITIRGSHLALIRDALDEGTLQCLRVNGTRSPTPPGGTIITAIEFAVESP